MIVYPYGEGASAPYIAINIHDIRDEWFEWLIKSSVSPSERELLEAERERRHLVRTHGKDA